MTGPKTQQRFLGRNAFILDSFLYTEKAACFMFSFRIYDSCGSGRELHVPLYQYCFSSRLVEHTTATLVPTWCQPLLVMGIWSNSLDEVPAFTLSFGMLQSTPTLEYV